MRAVRDSVGGWGSGVVAVPTLYMFACRSLPSNSGDSWRNQSENCCERIELLKKRSWSLFMFDVIGGHLASVVCRHGIPRYKLVYRKECYYMSASCVVGLFCPHESRDNAIYCKMTVPHSHQKMKTVRRKRPPSFTRWAPKKSGYQNNHLPNWPKSHQLN